MTELTELKALLKKLGIEHYKIMFEYDTIFGDSDKAHWITLSIYDSNKMDVKERKLLHQHEGHPYAITSKLENQTLTPQF